MWIFLHLLRWFRKNCLYCSPSLSLDSFMSSFHAITSRLNESTFETATKIQQLRQQKHQQNRDMIHLSLHGLFLSLSTLNSITTVLVDLFALVVLLFFFPLPKTCLHINGEIWRIIQQVDWWEREREKCTQVVFSSPFEKRCGLRHVHTLCSSPVMIHTIFGQLNILRKQSVFFKLTDRLSCWLYRWTLEN